MKASEYPTIPGPYRMHTASGNTYFCIVAVGRHRESRDASYHVFQPIRFRSETCLSHSHDDISRQFEPTAFEPLVLCNPATKAHCRDMQEPITAERLAEVAAE